MHRELSSRTTQTYTFLLYDYWYANPDVPGISCDLVRT
jgi:hypothetical protein